MASESTAVMFGTITLIHWLCLAMTAKRVRLASDPSVGVHDLCKVINEVLEQEGCRDMTKLLQSRHKVSWKTSPDGEWLGSGPVSSLCKKLFGLHSNGVLASKKIKLSLLKIQNETGRINFGRMHDNDFADSIDESIRIAASQFREIKKDFVKYSRAVRKCSEAEKANIDSVLAQMTLVEGVMEAKPGEEPTVEPKGEPKVLKDVLLEDKAPAIFSKVLKKEASDPASPNFRLKSSSLQKQEEEKQVSLFSNSTGASSSKAAVLPSPQDVEADEVAELQAWMQREAAVGPKKSKKSNKKGKAMKVAKDVDKKKMKKPASAVSSTKDKKATQATYKTTFLHRVTSSAWNKAKKAALRSGLSEEEAKAAGRKASQEMAQKVNRGELKEA